MQNFGGDFPAKVLPKKGHQESIKEGIACLFLIFLQS